MAGSIINRAPNPSTVLSVFLVKIFSIFRSLSVLSIFRSPSVILVHSLNYACAAPPLCTITQASPAPIDFVRAKVAAGGELGAKVACKVTLKIDQLLRLVGPFPYSVFRGMFKRKYKRIVGLGALWYRTLLDTWLSLLFLLDCEQSAVDIRAMQPHSFE